ncbi:hypothetical protein BC828DRAFT_382782 [Blastocladiella britannica]|nr:hypothetical protein BC828DRAFT_382782 [Blastocladiella britannica]
MNRATYSDCKPNMDGGHDHRRPSTTSGGATATRQPTPPTAAAADAQPRSSSRASTVAVRLPPHQQHNGIRAVHKDDDENILNWRVAAVLDHAAEADGNEAELLIKWVHASQGACDYPDIQCETDRPPSLPKNTVALTWQSFVDMKHMKGYGPALARYMASIGVKSVDYLKHFSAPSPSPSSSASALPAVASPATTSAAASASSLSLPDRPRARRSSIKPIKDEPHRQGGGHHVLVAAPAATAAAAGPSNSTSRVRRRKISDSDWSDDGDQDTEQQQRESRSPSLVPMMMRRSREDGGRDDDTASSVSGSGSATVKRESAPDRPDFDELQRSWSNDIVAIHRTWAVRIHRRQRRRPSEGGEKEEDDDDDDGDEEEDVEHRLLVEHTNGRLVVLERSRVEAHARQKVQEFDEAWRAKDAARQRAREQLIRAMASDDASSSPPQAKRART